MQRRQHNDRANGDKAHAQRKSFCRLPTKQHCQHQICFKKEKRKRGEKRRKKKDNKHATTRLNRAVAGTHASELHKALFSVPPIGHAPPTKNHGFVALESTTCRVALYTGSEELTKPRYGKLSNDGTFASSMCIALPNPSVS